MNRLTIGTVPVDNPLVLAPLAGITDMAMRLCAKRAGCGLVTSEMVSARGLHHGSRPSHELLRTCEEEAPLSLQIFGAVPSIMAGAAKSAAAAGASIVDINMGCPVRKVIKAGAGIALMRDTDLAARIVTAVREAVDVPVTVKIRLGPDGTRRIAVPFAQAMQEAGADAVAVHARFGGTRYSTPADWSAIAEVKRAVDVPVIGNGDVFNGEDAARMLEETGCDGVMIGRGAMGRPWVFRQVLDHLEGRTATEPARAERLRVVREHLDLLCAIKPEGRAVREFRKHLGWYTKGLAGGSRFRGDLAGIETRRALEHHIETFFGAA